MKPKRKKAAGTPAPPTSATKVQFELQDPGAREVCLAGTFNDWHPQSFPLVDLGGGRWAKELMLPPGVYEYLFVVDGRWLPDPKATDGVPNAFGGWNSRVQVS